MASPQVENGAVSIATSLHQAIFQTNFTSLERRVLDIVMYMTYGYSKSKSEMSVHDIRYMLGPVDKNRTDRIQKTLDGLLAKRVLFNQEIGEGRYLVGIQKDYDKWLSEVPKHDKMSHQSSITNIYTNKQHWGDKMSPSEKLVDYACKKLNLKLPVKLKSVEMKRAKILYSQLLKHFGEPVPALFFLKDCVDMISEDKYVLENVRFPMAYMANQLDTWLARTPRKTRTVKVDEEITGYRFRYDIKKGRWVRSADKLV